MSADRHAGQGEPMIVWRLPKEASEDPFRPPRQPCDVFCLHCGKQYSSDKMQWKHHDGKGAWCCPTHGCDGVGFQFDIFPLTEMGGQSGQGPSQYDDAGQENELDDGPW